MIGYLRNWMKKQKKDNRGAAMILVIVSIAFIGMLVAMIVYMAYCNYLMKGTDRVAKNNFYSAESALDAINAGLQQDVSDSMAEAYVQTMQNSSGLSADQMSLNFQTMFFGKIKEKIADNPTATDPTWKLSHLTDMLTNDSIPLASASGERGAWLEPRVTDGNKLVQKGTAYITLENVRVVYTDEKGYVSIIETDIRIKVPELNYAVASSRLDVENYFIIANTSLINDGKNNDGNSSHAGGSTGTDITGNVFGGNDGVYVSNSAALSFVDDTLDSVDSYYLISGSLNVNNVKDRNGIAVDDKHENYTGGITVTTGNLDLDGTTYVADDLTVDGNTSRIKLSGIYRGYGDSLSGADNSSSILINGARTSLDFSKLKELLLSGHAYVGTKHYDADIDRYKAGGGKEDSNSDYIENIEEYETTLGKNTEYQETETTVKKNTSDILLGESLSVKADQLIYMIPAECMGYNAKTGEQVLAKNPMSYDEYRKLTETYVLDENNQPTKELVYQPVNLEKLWEKLGNSYTNNYKAVFRRVNGSVLVYFYLDFGSNEVQANNFFKAYYEYDKQGLTDYIKSYVSDIKWNSTLNSNDNDKLTIAGNAFYFNNAGELVLQDDTLNGDTDKLENSISNGEVYSDTYTSLLHMLKPNILDTTSLQQSQTVFENIVDANAVNNKIKTQNFQNDDGSIKAHVDKGDYIYDGDANLKLIIAMKDVYLRSDFDGLVIAGGSVYIGSGCKKVTYNPTAVLKALRTKCPSGFYAYEALGDSGVLSYAETTEVVGNEYIDLGSLIVYQNWKKE